IKNKCQDIKRLNLKINHQKKKNQIQQLSGKKTIKIIKIIRINKLLKKHFIKNKIQFNYVLNYGMNFPMVRIKKYLNQLTIFYISKEKKGQKLKVGQVCQKLLINQEKFFQVEFRQNHRSIEFQEESEQEKAIKLFENPLEYSRKAIQLEKRENQHLHNYDQAQAEFFLKYKNVYDTDELRDQEYEDQQVTYDNYEGKNQSKKQVKIQEKQQQKKQTVQSFLQGQMNKSIQNCNYCVSNNKLLSEQIISLGYQTAFIFPNKQRYENIFHGQIIPFEHYSSLTELDDDVLQEVRNFQKCLVNCFDKKDMEVLFFENAAHIKKNPHLVLECIVLPRKSTGELCAYFKQAMENMESEWNTHKKIYVIKKEQGGIQKQIPKGFPYFYVDFNLSFGYAHVVEKVKQFSNDFAHEIICQILNIEKLKVLNPQKLNKEQLENKKKEFKKIWNEYDWTKML
ncbi:hypothetical protein IMG5_012600, partial [Ichthyophthirius multifiliis]